MRRRLALFATLAVMTTIAGACGVNDSGNAQRITPGLGLDDAAPTTSTTTTTTTTTTTPTASTTETTASTTTTTLVQTELVQLWFISGTQLNEIKSLMPYPASLGQVLAALQRGPGELAAATLRNAVPASPTLTVKDNGDGTATVDLPVDFFGTIPGPDQRLAIGQIVVTLTLRPGIGSVRFTQGGDDAAVILGGGEQSSKGQLVTRADYATLTGEAPPSATTATAATTTAAPEPPVAETTVAPG
ncbi:MAG: GerMN domain-containing protein [Ilumatobacteraceae bacterium]